MPDNDKVVLMVDMLGFAALIEETPDAVDRLRPVFQPLTFIESYKAATDKASDGALVKRFTGFHRALERRIRNYISKDITAITFSDSAFIHIPESIHVARFASQLMRDLLESKVPARMGIAAGSFAALRFSTDNTTTARVNSTQFLGTAVVRAYNAERSGIKGMRIVVHPSMRPVVAGFTSVEQRRYLRLPEVDLHSYAEVNYLYNRTTPPATATEIQQIYETHRDSVTDMREDAPAAKHHYYDNTLKALNRMRLELKKK